MNSSEGPERQDPAKTSAVKENDTPRSFGQVIAAISNNLDPERIGAGQFAELRRMAWNEFPTAFWHFYFGHVPRQHREPYGRPRQDIDLAWATVLRAMAEAGEKPHDPNAYFGAVLAESGYSEQRFVRLLRAQGEDLGREMRVAAAWLAHARQRVNWLRPAELLMGRIGSGLNIQLPDAVVHSLARDYFRVAAATSQS